MKKMLLSLGLLAGLTAFTVSQQSCISSDVISNVFPEFVTEYIEVPFEIPVVTGTNTSFVKMDTTQVEMNIDQMIRDQTSGAFGIDAVGSITLEAMNLRIENADAENNWANFTGIATYISSDANDDGVLAGSKNPIPDSYAADLIIDVDQSVKLKSYLSGNKIYYGLFGANRRATTKAIKGTAYVKYRLK